FDSFFTQKLLLTILGAGEEFAAGLGNIFWIGLALQNNLHVHLWAQLLIGHMNGDFVPSNFAEKAKQLTPKSVELAWIRIFGQTPAPEILNAEHRRQASAIALRGHQNPASLRTVIALMKGPNDRPWFGGIDAPILSKGGQLRPGFAG